MGTKNRILLGVVNSIIFHNIRNIFKRKELHITKRKFNLIKKKHADIICYIGNKDFQIILDNTIATCSYKDDGIYNFLAFIDGRYILYAISINNYYTELATLFYTRKRQLIVCKDSIEFFNKEHKKIFDQLIKN